MPFSAQKPATPATDITLLFKLLFGEVAAISQAADAVSFGSREHDALVVLYERRRQVAGSLELHWVDAATQAAVDQHSQAPDHQLYIQLILQGDKEAGASVWLFGEQVEMVFERALTNDALSGDQRIALARAWEAYSTDHAYVRALHDLRSVQKKENASTGILATLTSAVQPALAQ